MKTFLRTILSASILLVASSSAWAQGVNVALLDVGQIFKKHQGFKAEMEAMKARVSTFEQQLKAQQETIQKQSRQLGELKAGTAEYKSLEAQTTKQLAQLKVQMQLKRKEIMEDEAKIYMKTYKQVMAAVAAFANRHNVHLVLRYDRESAPTSEMAGPQETLKIINRPVIFQNQLDITDSILQQVGGVARKPATTGVR